jgi:hypothetical protein
MTKGAPELAARDAQSAAAEPMGTPAGPIRVTVEGDLAATPLRRGDPDAEGGGRYQTRTDVTAAFHLFTFG